MEPGFITAARRVLANRQAEKVDGILLDAFTASAMTAVYDALSPANRDRANAMPFVAYAAAAVAVVGKAQQQGASA